MISPDKKISSYNDVFPLGDDLYEVKDPAVYKTHKGWEMSFSRGTKNGPYYIGRAIAPSPLGPWQLLDNAVILDNNGKFFPGPDICATDDHYENDQYIKIFQTKVCHPGGTIELATSQDGKTYHHQRTLITSQGDNGIYDPFSTRLKNKQGKEELWMFWTHFSNWDKENKKPLGGSFRAGRFSDNNYQGQLEVMPIPILTEYNIPYHIPTKFGGEWTPEAVEAVQLDNGKILWHFVVFTDDKVGFRQKTCTAISDTVLSEKYHFQLQNQPVKDAREWGHSFILPFNKGLLEYQQYRQNEENSRWHICLKVLDQPLQNPPLVTNRTNLTYQPHL